MSRSIRRIGTALFIFASIAGCGRGRDTRANTEWLRTRTAPTVGEYLTDSSGRAVYMFVVDRKNESACSGPCAEAWPPLPPGGADGATTNASAPIQIEMIRAISRADHRRQMTYNGMPLYYYEDDERPGDIKGEGKNEFGGLWYVVSPDGRPIKPGAATISGG